jgi:hypothetical protein
MFTMTPLYSAYTPDETPGPPVVRTTFPETTAVKTLSDGEWIVSDISFEEIMTDPDWTVISEAEALKIG